jgi:hypothetical protein
MGAIPTPNGFYLDAVLSGKMDIFPSATKRSPVILVGHDNINHLLWYQKGKLFMDGHEILIPTHMNMTGGGDSKSKQYTIPIRVFSKGNKESKIIGSINMTAKTSFSCVLKKINDLLKQHSLKPIDGFHYIQEDADIAYVDKELVKDTDLYYSIKFDTEFYINYDELAL